MIVCSEVKFYVCIWGISDLIVLKNCGLRGNEARLNVVFTVQGKDVFLWNYFVFFVKKVSRHSIVRAKVEEVLVLEVVLQISLLVELNPRVDVVKVEDKFAILFHIVINLGFTQARTSRVEGVVWVALLNHNLSKFEGLGRIRSWKLKNSIVWRAQPLLHVQLLKFISDSLTYLLPVLIVAGVEGNTKILAVGIGVNLS